MRTILESKCSMISKKIISWWFFACSNGAFVFLKQLKSFTPWQGGPHKYIFRLKGFSLLKWMFLNESMTRENGFDLLWVFFLPKATVKHSILKSCCRIVLLFGFHLFFITKTKSHGKEFSLKELWCNVVCLGFSVVAFTNK